MNKIVFLIISLGTSLTTFAAVPAGPCADFSGSYKAAEAPNLSMITLAQQNCENISFDFDGKSLLCYLDSQSRVIKNDTLIKVIQAGKINQKYMMIFLTVAYYRLNGPQQKESILLFEKSSTGEVWLTFKGDVPDEVVAERKYSLIRQ
ncbi:MAG: hypothetical protein SGJ18_15845 [Pseudomonadota bacterium]|nr:hypothetical protein [Pseudomonadota bacterium]